MGNNRRRVRTDLILLIFKKKIALNALSSAKDPNGDTFFRGCLVRDLKFLTYKKLNDCLCFFFMSTSPKNLCTDTQMSGYNLSSFVY
jgi:hypothetical protein